MSALPHKPCYLHHSLPCQLNPSEPPHHVPPNPRARLSPPTLHLRKRLPPKQRQHRLPNRSQHRRLHDRHLGFLQQSFPGPKRRPSNRIDQRGHQLAGPGLQLTHLRGPLGNAGGVLGYEIHPSLKPLHRRMLIVCSFVAPHQPISASIGPRMEIPTSSTTPCAFLCSGRPASAMAPTAASGPIASSPKTRRLGDGGIRISGPSSPRRFVRLV